MNNLVNGKTRIYGIIGNPVAHSLSPVLHNTAFEELGINGIYVPFLTNEGRVYEALQGMRAMNISGLNVTMPYKQTVIPYLDSVDPMAEKIGAVNTIVNEEGLLKGYNTDADGFKKSMDANNVNWRSTKVAVLGAGGAARAICYLLAENCCDICILNRTHDRAKELAKSIAPFSDGNIRALKLNEDTLKRIMPDIRLLINATGIGMGSYVGVSIVPGDLLDSNMVVFDAIYHPAETELLRLARNKGATIIGGLDMLIWQGIIAFEKWTGLQAPFGIIKEKISVVLSKNEN